ncbi:MAG: murein transglycosylase A [Acidiferrobacterales bacterium]
MTSDVANLLPFFSRASRALTVIAILTTLALLSACSIGPGRYAGGLGKPVAWNDIKGWADDNQAEAWPALVQSCSRLENSDPTWRELCLEARLIESPDNETARAFFETRFVARPLIAKSGSSEGLITGYYEPLLQGSRKRTDVFRYAVYGRPADLLVIDLGDLYEDLRGKRVRGRLKGDRRVVPYFSREEIDNGKNPLKGNEIAWVADPVGLFFLHIQGSGRIRFQNGSELAVGYSDQNGHPYFAIGRRLIENGDIPEEKVSMQTIREWLRNNPDEAVDLLNSNPSYVFFAKRDKDKHGPVGSLGVTLTPERSIAVDRRVVRLGLPVWLDTTLPNSEEKIPYRRLVFAQDTGGAISGTVRADLFWGNGLRAEENAGRMRQPGSLFVLVPAQSKPVSLGESRPET